MNFRKQFFRVGIEEIADIVRQHHGEIEIIKDAEAVEYRKTLALIQGEQVSPVIESSKALGLHTAQDAAL